MKKVYDIVSVGFPLVEFMREEKGIPFNIPGTFIGPYPSGDTCIVLDVAARLGKNVVFVGTVGDDGFGDVVISRLNQDGVETQYVRRVTGYNTAAVFVRYDSNGDREYLDLIDNSACKQLNCDDIPEHIISSSKVVHFSGEVLSICQEGGLRKAMLKALKNVADDSFVSLDPNFTVEVKDMQEIMGPFISRANLILPSEGEASRLMQTETDEEACRQLALKGKTIALKRGEKGCTIYQGEKIVQMKSFHVDEMDPTGCGDSFCGGFLYGLLEGWEIEKIGNFANATGALQATERGPMEGAKYYNEVIKFITGSK